MQTNLSQLAIQLYSHSECMHAWLLFTLLYYFILLFIIHSKHVTNNQTAIAVLLSNQYCILFIVLQHHEYSCQHMMWPVQQTLAKMSVYSPTTFCLRMLNTKWQLASYIPQYSYKFQPTNIQLPIKFCTLQCS